MSRIAALSVTRAFQCQALHAGVLSFVPSVTGEALRFEAPVPPNMAGLIRALNDLPKDVRPVVSGCSFA